MTVSTTLSPEESVTDFLTTISSQNITGAPPADPDDVWKVRMREVSTFIGTLTFLWYLQHQTLE